MSKEINKSLTNLERKIDCIYTTLNGMYEEYKQVTAQEKFEELEEKIKSLQNELEARKEYDTFERYHREQQEKDYFRIGRDY